MDFDSTKGLEEIKIAQLRVVQAATILATCPLDEVIAVLTLASSPEALARGISLHKVLGAGNWLPFMEAALPLRAAFETMFIPTAGGPDPVAAKGVIEARMVRDEIAAGYRWADGRVRRNG